MRIIVVLVLVLAFLSLLSPPTPVSADLEGRVKKLEDELKTIRETSKAILARMESSVLDNLPAKVSNYARGFLDTVLHHGSKTATHVQREYPKWLAHAHTYTKDLPGAAQQAATVAQREGTKHFNTANSLLSKFLAQQGVPRVYIEYITLGVLALVALVVALITLAVLSSILSALFACCCGGGRQQRPSNAQIKKRNDKKAAEQHQQHKQNIQHQQGGQNQPNLVKS